MRKLSEMTAKEKKHVYLKKHVATIHCANTLSLLQRKVSNALLFHAYHELLQQDEHQITIQNLCNTIGYRGNNSAVIKKAVKALMSTVLEWNILNENTGCEEWTASSALASVRISGSLCIYSYSIPLKKLIYTPSVYGKINMVIQSKFNSAYGLALYENCIRYAGLYSTAWFDMIVFRKLMGVPNDQYLIFRDFKRRVLDKAVEEINTYSELQIELEVMRRGKRVEKIRFLLKNSQIPQTVQQASPDDAFSAVLVDRTLDNTLVKELVKNWKINVKQAQIWFQNYGEKKLLEKMCYVKSTNAFKTGSISKLGAYLRKALENDYQELQSSHQLSEKNVERKRELQRLIRKFKPEYEKFVQERLITDFRNLEPKSQQIIEQSFVEKLELTPDCMLDFYKKGGVELVKDVFYSFVTIHYPKLLKRIPTIEDFLETKLEKRI